ncbi:glycine N-acyltransferase-like isoform X2 [Saccostrea echinata]|uniref:glycine N-acyltransferase-like isoform X2 n=1 Tax=Saccostrea echinata TaxID=191078 RepID=UPI002A7F7476|nr:glycine N-acyltransferase-like isoform X2 [Saccostrea echinata]
MAVRVLDPTEYGKLEKDLETALPVSLFKKETTAWAIGFCKDPDFCQSLEKLLRHASKVLASPLIIAGCTEDVMDSLVNLFKSAESSPIRKGDESAYVYTFPPDKILPLKIPDGFKLSELQQTHVENVRNAWPYRDGFEQYADLRQWIRYHIDNFPTVCIETEDGRPVAWEFQQEYGAVGMLHVEPEYRRLKLGSVVTRILAQKLVKDGQLVFACVEERNETSVTFHENNGYIRLPFKYSSAVYYL